LWAAERLPNSLRSRFWWLRAFGAVLELFVNAMQFYVPRCAVPRRRRRGQSDVTPMLIFLAFPLGAAEAS
jgi:hypothetical protein